MMKSPLSLAQGLSPLADKMKHIPRQQTVMRLVATLTGDDPKAGAQKAQELIRKWLEQQGYMIPEADWNQDNYESELPGTPIKKLRFITTGLDYWVVQFDQPEKSTFGQYVGRIWSTEISLILQAGSGTFALRQRVSNPGPISYISPQVPEVVGQIADAVGLSNRSGPFATHAKSVQTDEEVNELLEVLRDEERQFPVFVVSEAFGTRVLIDPDELARRTVGLAQVYRLGREAAYCMTAQVTQIFSVFNGAVRTYCPQLNFDNDSPYDHPLALPDAIMNWAQGGGADKFIDFLVFKATELSLKYHQAEKHIWSFSAVKRRISQTQPEKAVTYSEEDTEKLELAEKRIQALEIERDEWEQVAHDEADKAKKALERVQDAETRADALQNRIALLETRFEEETGQSIDAMLAIPDSYSGMSKWAKEHLAGRLVITPKAVRAAKSALFEDVVLVYRCLLLLANEYRNMKIQGGSSRSEFEKACRKLTVTNSKTGDATRLGEEGEQYRVQYKGQPRTLDWHLKKGRSRDPRLCFRLYYFWDEVEQLTVVGWLPGHLNTRTS